MASDEEILAVFRRAVAEPETLKELVKRREYLEALARVGTPEDVEAYLAALARIGPPEKLRRVVEGIDADEAELARAYIRARLKRAEFWNVIRLWIRTTGSRSREVALWVVAMVGLLSLLREPIMGALTWLVGR